MNQLKIKEPVSKKAHFDPDLIKDAYKRSPNWKGIFGQQGGALTHLDNQDIDVGDIFLFYGSFKRTYLEDGILKFENDYERHIIFGYLVVGEKININNETSELYDYHPHFVNKSVYKKNTVFIASRDEDFGTFKYNKELVLTKQGFSKSYWELPLIFNPKNTTISHHSEKDYRVGKDKVMLKSRSIGQDFVIKDNIEIEKWARKIIREAKIF